MEDVMTRSRYPRKSITAKKRKRIPRNGNNLTQIIARQIAVCLLLFLLVFIIKSINTPVTNYLTEKVKYVLQLDYGLNSIFESLDGGFNSLREKIGGTGDNDMNSTGDNAGTADASETGTATDISTDTARDISTDTKTGSDSGTGIESLSAESTSPESSVLSYSTEEGRDLQVGFISPVDGVLSSQYGERTNPDDNTVEFHEGVDIAANEGDRIRATLGGIVVDTGTSSSYGKYIRLRHENGMETLYAHCSDLFTARGQKVVQGDIIGNVGSTGDSTGAHLHFEIHQNGKVLNPLEYVSIPLQ